MQGYRVNYTINVDATKGTEEVIKFANAVSKLFTAKALLAPTVNNIQGMMQDVEKAFGKRKNREYSLKININTEQAEKKLDRIKTLLGDIKDAAKGIKLVINAGDKLNTNSIKAEANKIIHAKSGEAQPASDKKNATSSADAIRIAQKNITQSVGKINSALISLERGRELKIKTDTAKGQLNEVLGLLGQIKGASVFSMGFMGGMGTANKAGNIFPFSPLKPFGVSDKAYANVQEKLYAKEAQF